MVFRLPLVPLLLTWAQKILGLAFGTKADTMVLSSHDCAVVKMILGHRTSGDGCDDRCRLGHGLLIHNRLHHWLWVSLNNDGWLRLSDNLCGDDTSWQDSIAVMEEHDLSELASVCLMLVVELEPDLLGLSMDLGELELEVFSETEVKVSDGNFVPATLQKVPDEDLDMGWGFSWVVTSALEADTFEVKLIRELNLDPRSVVVL